MAVPKILIVNMMVPSGDGEGPQYTGEWRDGYELAIALARAGGDITLLSPSIGKHEKEVRKDIDPAAIREGVKLCYAPFILNRRLGGIMTICLSIAWIWEYFKLRPKLVIFKQIRPDFGMLIPGIKNKSLALTCGEIKQNKINEIATLIYRTPSFIERSINYMVQKILNCHSLIKDPVTQFGKIGFLVETNMSKYSFIKRLPQDSAIALPKGILSYGLPNVEDDTSSNSSDALFCGAIGFTKGIFELIDAWKRLPLKFKLKIIGVGTPLMQEKLIEAIKELPNLEYLGAVKYFDKLKYFRNAKIFILPAKIDHNPSVIYEALSLGIPVITTSQIISPIRHNFNGLIVKANDIESLSGAIQLLLTNEVERKRMSQNARETALQYTWDRAVSEISSLAGGLPKVHLKYPSNICFLISALCQARCIFCPPDRGKRIFPKLMEYSLFSKIIENAKKDSFAGTFVFGENGEPLLHPDFVKMLENTRLMFPENRIILFTNMERLDKEMSDVILKNKVNELHFNYDGATAETYTYVKSLDFDKVTENIKYFLIRRNSENYQTKVQLQIISAHRYKKTMGLKDAVKFKDDSKQAAKIWKKYLKPYDNISFTPILRWALNTKQSKAKNTPCGMLNRIKKNLYIAPSGSTYLCCLDSNANLVYGDLKEGTIIDLWHSSKREKMIDILQQNNFENMGFPCSVCMD